MGRFGGRALNETLRQKCVKDAKVHHPAQQTPAASSQPAENPARTALLYELPPDSSGRGPPPPEWQRLRRAQWFAWMRDITAKETPAKHPMVSRARFFRP